MKNLIISLCALLVFNVVSGQNKEFSKEFFPDQKDGLKKALSEIKSGDQYYSMGEFEYRYALPYYLKAYEFNPDNAELNYKIAKTYLHSNNKTKSLNHSLKALNLNPHVASDLRFVLARGYHLNADWDKAMEEYKKYRNTLDEKKEQEQIRYVMKLIGECINGKELVKNPVRVFIDNPGTAVNSKYPDYAPVITADGGTMMFTSRRDGGLSLDADAGDGMFYEDIYVTTRSENGWTPVKNMGKPINTEDHDATIGLSPDGSRLLIYKDEKGGDLFYCTLSGETWSKPEKFDKNINTGYHESSACYSPDGKVLYFVSDRPDLSLGGRDIFTSTLNEKGKWSDPVNIGAVINTPYDEESVFMHPDGKTLYFSSKGHSTMGAHDIFKTVFENGKWTKPENLGYPINTPDDDVFFVLSASGREGYYSSFRPDGVGEKDIYMITFLGPEKPVMLASEDNLLASLSGAVRERVIEPTVEVTTAKVTLLRGVITDAITTEPLEAEIELIDNAKNQVLAVFRSNSTTGKYLVSLPSGKNYGIAVKKEGYLFHSENFDIPALADYQEVQKDIPLKNIAVGSKIVLRNIFFDFDKSTLRSESTSELERLIKLLQDVPSMRIEISGHTDNKGADEYNLKLSESRAKTVVEYLVEKGIDKSRLESAGYGESQPMATNDTEEGRQENRRTEFKILSR